jgi:hypothetical protein
MEHLRPVHSRVSAVIVTTPQAVALLDAMKCLSFARAVDLPVLGIIENMSGYVCPCCGEVSNVFSTGGGEALAKREKVPFLGSLPVDTELVTLLDAAQGADAVTEDTSSDGDPCGGALEPGGFELWRLYGKTSSAKLFETITERIVHALPTMEGEIEASGAIPFQSDTKVM